MTNLRSLRLSEMPTLLRLAPTVQVVQIDSGPVKTLKLSQVISDSRGCLISWHTPARLVVDRPQPRLTDLTPARMSVVGAMLGA